MLKAPYSSIKRNSSSCVGRGAGVRRSGSLVIYWTYVSVNSAQLMSVSWRFCDTVIRLSGGGKKNPPLAKLPPSRLAALPKRGGGVWREGQESVFFTDRYFPSSHPCRFGPARLPARAEAIHAANCDASGNFSPHQPADRMSALAFGRQRWLAPGPVVCRPRHMARRSSLRTACWRRRIPPPGRRRAAWWHLIRAGASEQRAAVASLSVCRLRHGRVRPKREEGSAPTVQMLETLFCVRESLS